MSFFFEISELVLKEDMANWRSTSRIKMIVIITCVCTVITLYGFSYATGFINRTKNDADSSYAQVHDSMNPSYIQSRNNMSPPYAKTPKEFQQDIHFLKLSIKAHAEAIAMINMVPQDFFGGAPNEKGMWLVETIVRNNLQNCVEIGVWRGRSFIPLVVGVKYTGGHAVGIDPYTADAMAESEAPEPILADIPKHIGATDFNKIYMELQTTLRSAFNKSHFTFFRKTAQNAVDDIRFAIDLLHIDGNHDRELVAVDIALYVPKVRPGGWIILDDTDWASVRPTLKALNKHNAYQVMDAGSWQAWRKWL